MAVDFQSGMFDVSVDGRDPKLYEDLGVEVTDVLPGKRLQKAIAVIRSNPEEAMKAPVSCSHDMVHAFLDGPLGDRDLPFALRATFVPFAVFDRGLVLREDLRIEDPKATVMSLSRASARAAFSVGLFGDQTFVGRMIADKGDVGILSEYILAGGYLSTAVEDTARSLLGPETLSALETRKNDMRRKMPDEILPLELARKAREDPVEAVSMSDAVSTALIAIISDGTTENVQSSMTPATRKVVSAYLNMMGNTVTVADVNEDGWTVSILRNLKIDDTSPSVLVTAYAAPARIPEPPEDTQRFGETEEGPVNTSFFSRLGAGISDFFN